MMYFVGVHLDIIYIYNWSIFQINEWLSILYFINLIILIEQHYYFKYMITNLQRCGLYFILTVIGAIWATVLGGLNL